MSSIYLTFSCCLCLIHAFYFVQMNKTGQVKRSSIEASIVTVSNR